MLFINEKELHDNDEWNTVFNNVMDAVKSEYYDKYGVECPLFDIDKLRQNAMSDEDNRKLITALRDWIKNGKGDLMEFFKSYLNNFDSNDILKYIDLLESLLPEDNEYCVICFRMINEHDIYELNDCIDVHQTILQEIYKARLQRKVKSIWKEKQENIIMKEEEKIKKKEEKKIIKNNNKIEIKSKKNVIQFSPTSISKKKNDINNVTLDNSNKYNNINNNDDTHNITYTPNSITPNKRSSIIDQLSTPKRITKIKKKQLRIDEIDKEKNKQKPKVNIELNKLTKPYQNNTSKKEIKEYKQKTKSKYDFFNADLDTMNNLIEEKNNKLHENIKDADNSLKKSIIKIKSPKSTVLKNSKIIQRISQLTPNKIINQPNINQPNINQPIINQPIINEKKNEEAERKTNISIDISPIHLLLLVYIFRQIIIKNYYIKKKIMIIFQIVIKQMYGIIMLII